MSKCQRCGLCCMRKTETHWRLGNFSNVAQCWSNSARDASPKEIPVPCQMLRVTKTGRASCILEDIEGVDCRPDDCKPENKVCVLQKIIKEHRQGSLFE